MTTTEIKQTPIVKRILKYVDGDIGYDVRYSAGDIACAIMPAGWSMRTYYNYVDKIHDLAKAGLIHEHDMGWYHSNDGMCIDCDPTYN